MLQMYQPLELNDEIMKLRADMKALSQEYTRRFTRNHIVPFHGYKGKRDADKD